MGYDARGNGVIALNRKPEDIPAGICNKALRAFSEVEPSPDGGLWLTLEMDRYREDDIKEFLTAIAPYTVSGHIEFIGEDDDMWRFVFIRGEWREERGQIVWEPVSCKKTVDAELYKAIVEETNRKGLTETDAFLSKCAERVMDDAEDNWTYSDVEIAVVNTLNELIENMEGK